MQFDQSPAAGLTETRFLYLVKGSDFTRQLRISESLSLKNLRAKDVALMSRRSQKPTSSVTTPKPLKLCLEVQIYATTTTTRWSHEDSFQWVTRSYRKHRKWFNISAETPPDLKAVWFQELWETMWSFSRTSFNFIPTPSYLEERLNPHWTPFITQNVSSFRLF